MMLPIKTDPRWRKLAENPESFKEKVSVLPTRMLLSGLKIKSSSHTVEQLIDVAHDFFVKNEDVVSQDIESLFS
jgi:hypothetical protein